MKVAAAEDTTYSQELQAWVPNDIHDPLAAEHASCFAWCWGMPGIAVGRLSGSGPKIPLPSSAAIEPAAFLTMTASRMSSCCGTVGRIDVFLELRAEGCPHHSLLKHSVSEVLKEFARSGSTLFGRGPERLGLMQGISGLGYMLLRHNEPLYFPCVLSLGI